MLELRVLGQFEVRVNDAVVLLASRPAQSLLAYLALSAGTAHRREKLAGLFWLDADEDNARANLRHALWRIRKAVEAQPKTAAYWKTLGWAQYRAGNWHAAVTALEKVKELGSAGDSLEWFPLAMAHWRLGNKPAARKYYDQAVQWMEKDARKNDQLRRDKVATYRDKHAAYGQTLGPDLKNVDLRHLRAEAEQVLGIQKKN